MYFLRLFFFLMLSAALHGAADESLDESLHKNIKFKNDKTNFIGRIYIGDHSEEINQSTWLYVKKALDHYKEIKPIFVILELNTPGGELYSAQKISDALKEMDIQYGIPVVCFINNWAISAGAMLAYSCRYILPVKDASMGAAEPLTKTGEEIKEASEKVNSAIRTDFGNRANFFDRNPDLAEAMVDKDIILVYREGKIIRLDNESQIVSSGEHPDTVISAKGKLLTLNSEQMLKYGVANAILSPSRLIEITPQEREKGEWPLSKTLLAEIPFFKAIPNAIIVTYELDWKMRFFALLASPIVSSLLFLGLMIGFYMEISSPGFGVPGTLALTCLILIILSSFALDIANWLELILLLIGISLLIFDFFVLPTFGLMGSVGTIFFLAGLLGMMLPGLGNINYEFDTNTFNAAGEIFFNRLAWLSATFVLTLLIIFLLARYITPSFGLYKRLILQGNEQDASAGYVAGESAASLPPIGTPGEVAATLRPAGKVIIGDKIYDAISTGGFIEKGSKVIVARNDGGVIAVEGLNREEL